MNVTWMSAAAPMDDMERAMRETQPYVVISQEVSSVSAKQGFLGRGAR